MVSKAPGADFQSDPRAMVFFIFEVPKRFSFVKQLHGAHFSIVRDIHVVVGHRLRTRYHMPYLRSSYLGIPTASCGIPPNLLELTGFKLGVHFPSLNKFQEKNLGL
jgi:hypothetical protein